MIEKLRNEARRLLDEGIVSVVIGWQQGSMPFKTAPVFVEKGEDVDKLIWNNACTNNLAKYLTDYPNDKKIAICAKPCDSKSINVLLSENQIKRENIYIIGFTCAGITDSIKVADLGIDNLTEETAKFACLHCETHIPVISDIIIGEEPTKTVYADDKLPETFEEKRKYWENKFSKCIRCYACRQICPSCYCKKCFADRIEPKWTAKKATTDEAWMFHATRVMHLAGRCVGCGECERACPMSIPIEELSRDMAKYIKEIYNYTAGVEEEPLLGTYKDTDYDPSGQ